MALADSADETQVRNGSAGDEHHVEVGQHQRAQRDPGVLLVPDVELADLCPEPVPHGMLGEVLEPSARDVAAGVTGDRVHPEHDDVDDEDDVAQTEAEAAGTVLGVERLDRIPGVDCLLYTSPSPRDRQKSRMPSSA